MSEGQVWRRRFKKSSGSYGQTLVVAPHLSGQKTEEETLRENKENLNIQDGNNFVSYYSSQPNVGQPQGFARTGVFENLKGIFQNETEKTKVLGDYIGAFESITTVEYTRGVKNYGWQRFLKKLWHRNYFEHIIRTPRAYFNISNYIINNPATWEQDKYFNNCEF